MNYWSNLFIAFDQLFNAIRGGYADSTISATCGYHAVESQKKYWLLMERLIDWAFEPIEEKHCFSAYLADRHEQFYDGGVISKTVLAVTILFWTPLIALAIRIYALITGNKS